MHALRLKETKSVPVKYLRARCGVRYWEDGEVNGVEDTDGSRIPCRQGTAADNDKLGGGNWCPTIRLEQVLLRVEIAHELRKIPSSVVAHPGLL